MGFAGPAAQSAKLRKGTAKTGQSDAPLVWCVSPQQQQGPDASGEGVNSSCWLIME